MAAEPIRDRRRRRPARTATCPRAKIRTRPRVRIASTIAPATCPVHAFVGGNTWVPGIIQGEYGTGLGRSGTGRTRRSSRRSLGARVPRHRRGHRHDDPELHAADRQHSGSMALQVTLPISPATNCRPVTRKGGACGSTCRCVTQRRPRVRERRLRCGECGADARIRKRACTRCCRASGTTTAPAPAISRTAAARRCSISSSTTASREDSRIPPLGIHAGDGRPIRMATTCGRSASSPIRKRRPAQACSSITTPRLYPVAACRHSRSIHGDRAPLLPDCEQLLHRVPATEAASNNFPAENDLCTGGPDRPFTVGPQQRSRGEYAYELWNNAADDAQQPGYGKSPPELIQVGAATTSR